MIKLTEKTIRAAVDKATLCKTNSYNNADFEGFIDKDLLFNELGFDNVEEDKNTY